jgi:uncharacterized membrane protein YkvI
MEKKFEEQKNRYKIKEILKYSGAYIAFTVGSGFATGQEILLFFTSYGYASYAVVLFNLVSSLFLGKIMLTKGYEHKSDNKFNPYQFYCGKNLGTLYSRIIQMTLLLSMSVMISASGATLYEYYGINRYTGSAVMAIMVLTAYLIGFEKLVKLVSVIAPVIIAFALLVGTVTVIHDFHNFGKIGENVDILTSSQSSPNWVLSSVLYLSLNFFLGSTYYAALGKSAKSRNDAKWGAISGAIALILVIVIMNTAILLNAENTASLGIPALFLAKKISYTLGATFSIVLMLGIFSSCSTMMWSFCNQFFTEGTWENRLFAVVIAAFIFALGLFPFRNLAGIIFPLIGYLGLVFIGCVFYKGIKNG